jgi:hypothetical protein
MIAKSDASPRVRAQANYGIGKFENACTGRGIYIKAERNPN